MQTARNKIAHAVARGYDFTHPRIIDRKNPEKSRQAQTKPQDLHIEKNEILTQKQNREHNKDKDRSR